MKSYYILVVASFLARFIPARLGYWLSSLIGGLVFYVTPSIRRAVMDNLHHVLPNSSPHQRRTLSRRVIRNVLKNYYDLIRLQHMSAQQIEDSLVVYGMEHVEKVLEQGRGAIVVGGHIGNFSIVAQVAAIRGYKAAIVAENVKPQKLYDYVNHLRAKFGITFIRVGSSQVRSIVKFLRTENGILMLAADRDVTDTGEPVQFFDAVADLPPGPVVLAARLNVPLVPAYTMRLKNNKSVVNIHPPLELQRTGDHESDTRENMRRVAQFLEKSIVKAPNQWVVLQRVWDHEEQAEDAAQPGSTASRIIQPTLQTEDRSPSSVS